MTSVVSGRRAECQGLRGEVAIIGMACIFPGAPNLNAYWQNIASGVDAITDVPEDRWDVNIFFDPNSTADDRVYCKRGGYLGDSAQFNPLDYGVMPVVIDGGEAEQFLSLRIAYEALADAGYADRPFNQERTEIILGRGNYSSRGSVNLTLHSFAIEQMLQILHTLHPEYSADELAAVKKGLKASLPHLSADTAASLIPNLTTGRIANRLDLMGANFTIDAACASALIATDLAVRDLLSGRCDLALVGGVHLANHVPFLSVFCQLNALSRRSQIRPFDENADGTLPGEGVGMAVLKRKEDAERDSDRIYAVIKGVGVASDGRGQGLLTPRVEGEELALRRAYEMAGIPPDTIELIEAHGTGTPVGDVAEIQTLTRVFGGRKGALPTCAVGTVKSMIGHLMPAAGIAGLIKTALAVYHKVLPPTLHCETPNPKLDLIKTPFYVNTETRPWIHGMDIPRRAGVNSFGFGGINAHVILEEYPITIERQGASQPLCWEVEVCIVQGASRQDLIGQVRRLERFLEAARGVDLKDLCYTLNTESHQGSYRLALVASSPEDFRLKLGQARERLTDPTCRQIKDVRGIYFFEEPLRQTGKLAFLFPGETSQYPNMLKDLCIHFPEVRAAFDRADRLFLKEERRLLPSQSVFPIPGSSEADRSAAERRLWEMGGALEAILTANWALNTLLRRLEIRPDMLLGHSSGEYSALVASGILADDARLLECLVTLNTVHERLTAEGRIPEAALAAVGADRKVLAPLLEGFAGQVYVSMDNCPHQVVIVGGEEAVEGAIELMRTKGVVCQRLPFNRAYHTPMFAAVAQPVREFLQSLAISPPAIEIYSCSTMAPYPRESDEIRKLVVQLWSRPVEFTRSVEALYDAGVRIFVEVGPKGNLTAFVEDILHGRPHLAMPCDVPRRSGIAQLNHVIGVLAAQGVEMRLDYLYERRQPQRLFRGPPGMPNGGGHKQPPSVPLRLNLPVMRLSSEQAASLVRPSPAPADGRVGAPADPGELRFITPEPALQSLPARQDLAFHGAGSTAALDQAGTPLGATSQAMQEHLQTMEHFLAVEEQVMDAFLGGGHPSPDVEGVMPPSTPAMAFPFVGAIVSLTPGEEVIIQRRLDPAEDTFLRDHAFGGQVSDIDEALRPLPVVPFTVCMEIMAEAAAVLMPGKVLTSMRRIQSRQWVEVGTPTTLEITARKRASVEEVDVEIRTLDGTTEAEVPSDAPLIEGMAIFGETYAQPHPVPPIDLSSGGPCRYTAEGMYRERLMFHGPCFQGVVSLDRSAENGIVGHLQVLPTRALFRSTMAPHLLIDPALLDAAGQLLGYWAAERLDSGYIVFPFRLSALEIYGSNPGVSGQVRCELEIQQVTPRQVRATMNLFSSDGRLWLRLVDWEDWRFFWPREFYDFVRFPKEHLVSESWEPPVLRLSPGGPFVCQRVELTPESTRAIIVHAVGHNSLSQAERRQWKGMQGPERRRTEWVFGRAVAKDAVRRLLQSIHGMRVCAADIEIGRDADGRPFASTPGLGSSLPMPSISIAHTAGLAVAIAGYCRQGQRLGIDVEYIQPRQEAFQGIAFSRGELTLLDSLAASDRDEWVARFWCAKEAVAKAWGKGLVEGPRSLEVLKVDVPTGTVEVVLGKQLSREFPEVACVPLVAYTAREEDHVVATTLCERR